MCELIFWSADRTIKGLKKLLAEDPSEAFFEALDWVKVRESVGLVGVHTLKRPGQADLHLEPFLKL